MLTASKQDFPQISLITAPNPMAPRFQGTPTTSHHASITPLPWQRPTRKNMTHKRVGSCFHMNMLLSPWPAR